MSDSYGKIKVDEIENSDGTLLDLTTAVTTEATTSTKGYLSAADKAKLDGIEAGAEVNGVTSVNGSTGAVTIQGFSTANNAKLDGIETGATADQTKADIDALNVDADTLDGQHGSYYTGYADTAVASLVDSSPSTLDTLNELAAALGDDPNFATTVTNSIGTKLPLAGGQMTGNIAFSGSQTVDGRDLSADGSKLDGISAGAEVNAVTSVNGATGAVTVQGFSGDYDDLTNKPDGSGSGLDADKVDGLEATSFLRSDANATYNGGMLTIRSNSNVGNYWGAGIEYDSGWKHTNANSWGFAFRNNGTNGLQIKVASEAGTNQSAATYRVLDIGGATQRLKYDNYDVWHAGNSTPIENAFGSSAPSSPSTGDFWVDTTDDPPELKSYDGTEWVAVGSSTPTTSAPVISNVVLTEDNASGDRFTSQTFSAAINMLDDGAPVSQKGIKGKVTASFTQYPITNASTNVAITDSSTSQSPGTLVSIQGYSDALSDNNREVCIANVINPNTGASVHLLMRWTDNGYTEEFYTGSEDLTSWTLLCSGSNSYRSDYNVITMVSEDGERVNCFSRNDDKPAQITLANVFNNSYGKTYNFVCYTDKYKYLVYTQGNPVNITRYLRSTNAYHGTRYLGSVASSSSARLTAVEQGDTLWLFARHSTNGTTWIRELSDAQSDTLSWPSSGVSYLYNERSNSGIDWTQLRSLFKHNGAVYSANGNGLYRFDKGVGSTGTSISVPTLSGYQTHQTFAWEGDKGQLVLRVQYYQISNSNNRIKKHYTTNNGGATWTPIYFDISWTYVSGTSSNDLQDFYGGGNRMVMKDNATNWTGRVYSLGYQDVTVANGATLGDLNVNDKVRLPGVTDSTQYNKITAITDNGNSTTTIRLVGGPDASVGDTIEAVASTGTSVSTRFLVIDATGAISTHQSSDPGFVTLGPGTSQSITFPATFPTGNAPDVELASGTTIQVEVEAVNSVASDTYPSNTVTPS